VDLKVICTQLDSFKYEPCFDKSFKNGLTTIAQEIRSLKDGKGINDELFASLFKPEITKIPGRNELVDYQPWVAVGSAKPSASKTATASLQASQLKTLLLCLAKQLQSIKIAAVELLSKIYKKPSEWSKHPVVQKTLETLSAEIQDLPNKTKKIETVPVLDERFDSITIKSLDEAYATNCFDLSNGQIKVKPTTVVRHNSDAKAQAEQLTVEQRSIGLAPQKILDAIKILKNLRDLLLVPLSKMGDHVEPLIRALKPA
jgi:hypothetical protein